MSEFNKLDFVRSQKPKAPFSDWRVYSLLIPAIFSAIGFFVFSILAYSFTEFSMIGDNTRFALVIIGGICLGIGAECGTLTNTIEIFRKHKLGHANKWDWSALVISLVTTLASFVLAFATLLGERANWSSLVQVWGAIAIGALSALDAYGGFLETGYLFADYEQRMEVWQAELAKTQSTPQDLSTVDTAHFQLEIARLQQDIDYLSFPVATLAWFKEEAAKLNGNIAEYGDMPPINIVKEICRVGGKRFDKSERTAYQWHKMIK